MSVYLIGISSRYPAAEESVYPEEFTSYKEAERKAKEIEYQYLTGDLYCRTTIIEVD